MNIVEQMNDLQWEVQSCMERPLDDSFEPISLCMMALLKTPLLGSLDQSPWLEQIDNMTIEEYLTTAVPHEQAYDSFRASVSYVKLCRAMLKICAEHVKQRMDCVQACDAIKQVSFDILIPESLKISKTTTGHWNEPPQVVHKRIVKKKTLIDTKKILQDAIQKDTGDGKSIVSVMHKFPDDALLHTEAMVAIKHAANKKMKKIQLERKKFKPQSEIEREIESISGDDKLKVRSQKDALAAVLASMRHFPKRRDVQLTGVRTLSALSSLHGRGNQIYSCCKVDKNIEYLVMSGGISVLMDTMVLLPDESEAHISAVGILGHPILRDDRFLHLIKTARQLVVSSMQNYSQNEKLQGLGCLALANLAGQTDYTIAGEDGQLEAVVDAMKTFPRNPNIQAAGCYAIGVLSKTNDTMLDAALTIGAIPLIEKARRHFPQDGKVQTNANLAMQILLQTDVGASYVPSCNPQ